MSATTNFEEWLEQVDPNHHEVWAIYQTVVHEESNIPFKLSKKGDTLFIEYPEAGSLMITAKGNNTFLRILEEKYCEGMDVESWYGLECALENEKA
jgi:hypothetical protein